MGRKFAIISDIHGNLEGLNAILKEIEKKNIIEIICLGDIIGYGANPVECWELCKERCSVILKGNHESIFIGEIDDSDCSTLGKQSADWTKQNFPYRYKNELKKLPKKWSDIENIAFFHTIPIENSDWVYLNQLEQILQSTKDRKEKLIFYGHNHRPRITIKNENGECITDLLVQKSKRITVNLSLKTCYINVGSAGQQRDTHTDVSFAVCEIENNNATIEIIRIPYKRYKAYRKILNDGCGSVAAIYLIREKWRRNLFAILDYWCKRIFR